MKVTITTPYVSTNALYTINRYNGKRVLTKKARVHKEAIAWEAKEQIGSSKPMAGELHVDIHWYMPDQRRRDIDNIKMVIDSLTGVLWKDDSNIWTLYMHKYVDKENPRIEVVVSR